MHGGWSDWTQWTECSHTCESGTRGRRRECNSPAPRNNGLTCPGTRDEAEGCNPQECPDACRDSPCFPGVPCSTDSDLMHVAKCGTCPLGFEGNGFNCSDVDEVGIKWHKCVP